MSTFGHRDHAEVCSASTRSATLGNLVHSVLGGIDITRKTATFASRALDLNTPVRNGVPKRNIRLNVNGVPANLDKSLARVQLVRTGNIWRPVSVWLILGSPDTSFFSAHARRVNVVTTSRLVNLSVWLGHTNCAYCAAVWAQ